MTIPEVHLRSAHRVYTLFLTLLLLLASSLKAAAAGPSYTLKYKLEFEPDAERAKVTLLIDKGELLRQYRFKNTEQRYANVKGNGKVTVTNDEVIWDLPEGEAWLSFQAKVSHQKTPGKYDALMTKDWAIFRGDDLFPSGPTTEVPGAYAEATLDVVLPQGWSGVETGWPRIKGNSFRINNPDRLFDRPVGWFIVGNLGTRRAKVGKTAIAVSAPLKSGVKRMEILTFMNFVWPEVQKAFDTKPKKLLMVAMGDPMWRGGLSASNSLFLHTDRPLVSENGTSPLLHEMTHMFTRLKGVVTEHANDDWIVEGLAEFYSFDLLYRAGGMSKDRRKKIIEKLAKWGADIKHLREGPSKGPITARAVVLLDELDKEIRHKTKGDASIDDLTRALMVKRKVSLADLRAAAEEIMGEPLSTLRSPLVN